MGLDKYQLCILSIINFHFICTLNRSKMITTTKRFLYWLQNFITRVASELERMIRSGFVTKSCLMLKQKSFPGVVIKSLILKWIIDKTSKKQNKQQEFELKQTLSFYKLNLVMSSRLQKVCCVSINHCVQRT